MEKAENIPSGLTGTDANGNEFEMSLADWARIQGGPRSGKPATGVLKFGVAAGDVKELASQKVVKIKEQIKNLKLTGELKQHELNSLGKHWDPSGSVKLQVAHRTIIDLRDRKHYNDAGKKVKWVKLTNEEQDRVIKEAMKALYDNARLVNPGVAGALNQGDTSDQDRLTDLDNFIKNKQN